MNHEIKENK